MITLEKFSITRRNCRSRIFQFNGTKVIQTVEISAITISSEKSSTYTLNFVQTLSVPTKMFI